MPSISSALLLDAALRVQRMSFGEREQLAEEIHTRQPNLFFSVLALQGFDAPLEHIEMVLTLLMVFHEAMKASGKPWPVISEEIQDRGLKRIAARARLAKRLPARQQARAAADAIARHPEQPMLAYVLASFGEHGLLEVQTETHKMLMLAALNLVESIGLTAPTGPEKTSPRR
jgi:hypothetical protein